jgi:hypothetical protein
MNTLDYKGYEVSLASTAFYDGNLAVIMLDEYGRMHARLTVNLPNYHKTDASCAYVDSNNHPTIVDWLKTNNIAEPTGMIAHSGFCEYPEMRFNFESEYFEKERISLDVWK